MRRIAEARVKTGDFIARLMMAYAGFAAFCVFTLLSPDGVMVEAKASLNMPFAGTVSFLAFMAGIGIWEDKRGRLGRPSQPQGGQYYRSGRAGMAVAGASARVHPS